MPTKAITLAALAVVFSISPTPGDVTGRLRLEGKPILHGTLSASDDQLSLRAEDGSEHTIDLSGLLRLDIERPSEGSEVEKFGSGDLPAPWNNTAVGELPHGGRADAKGGKAIIETSSPERGAAFGSFYMAYRPFPTGDAQITARVDRIDSYEDTTRAGLMLRDGLGEDARSVFLSVSHREAAGLRVWKGLDTVTTTADRRGSIRPGKWLRIVRSDGKITGYVSASSGYWREIASTPDEFEGEVFACLAAQGSKPRRRWSATYEDVAITPLSAADGIRVIRPQIVLADGNVFQSPIDSATTKLLKLAGDNAGRVLPLASIARIEFYRPIASDRQELLNGERSGVLISGGDFFESKLTGLTNGKLTASSTLFGKREFEIEAEVDALVLRAAKTDPPAGDYRIETWAGANLAGKNLRIEDGLLLFDTVRLRTQRTSLGELRRIIRTKPAP